MKTIDILATGKLMPVVTDNLPATFRLHDLSTAENADALVDSIAEQIRGLLTAGHGAVDGPFQDRFPNLEIIANVGVGYDTIDAVHAAGRNVIVTNTPDVLTDEVADTAFGLLIMTVRELGAAERWLRAGNWESGNYPLTRTTLRGKTIGIFGLGRIGKAIAKRAEAAGLKIVYCGRKKQVDVPYRHFVSAKGMAEHCDILLSAAPGTSQTHHAIDADVLKALGPEGILINIGRGNVVDEKALIAALQNGTIHSAGLDVFENEPHVPAELIAMDKIVLTPHIASASQHTRDAMGRLQLQNVVDWFDGKGPVSPVPETPWKG